MQVTGRNLELVLAGLHELRCVTSNNAAGNLSPADEEFYEKELKDIEKLIDRAEKELGV